MPTLTQEQVELTKLKPAIDRVDAIPGEIAAAEAEYAEALTAADYDDDAAEAIEQRIARLGREKERLEGRVRYLSRLLSATTGTGQRITLG